MTKIKNPAAKAAAAQPVGGGALPLIDKAPAAPTARVGVFNPNMLDFPTHEQLVTILLILGLTTNQFHGEDNAGNLVTQDGNIVIPAKVRQFFQLLPITAVAAAPKA